MGISCFVYYVLSKEVRRPGWILFWKSNITDVIKIIFTSQISFHILYYRFWCILLRETWDQIKLITTHFSTTECRIMKNWSCILKSSLLTNITAKQDSPWTPHPAGTENGERNQKTAQTKPKTFAENCCQTGVLPCPFMSSCTRSCKKNRRNQRNILF